MDREVPVVLKLYELTLWTMNRVFGDDRGELQAAVSATGEFLGQRLRLELNPQHLEVARTARGIAFLGMRVFPDHRRIAPASLARSVRRLRRRIAESGRALDARGRLAAALPWIAHLAHADTWRLRARVLTRLARRQMPPGKPARPGAPPLDPAKR